MSDAEVNKAVYVFLVLPLIIIIGIYVVATVISQLFFGTSNQYVTGFFCAVGGVGYFINYFRKKMAEYSN